jgi:thiol-disulfide isomerase/thioredoxin
MKKSLFTVLLFSAHLIVAAQKTVQGLKFSTCVNNPQLAKDFYKGKFLVLDFWATWCGPCIASFPKLNEIEEKYKDNNKVVFAAITAETKGKIDTFFATKGNPLPHSQFLIDDNAASFTFYDIKFIPRILVFSPEGKMVFDGRAEQLADKMDAVLKGETVLPNDNAAAPADHWNEYREQASFIAIMGKSSGSENESGGMSRNKDKVTFDYRNTPLIDVVSAVANITNTKISANDTNKLRERISLHYKQLKSQFPEFDKGLFEEQYKNHIIHLMERNFRFHAEWVMEKSEAYKIVVKNADVLKKHTTFSTKGAYSSLLDQKLSKYNFVNQQVGTFAEYAEEELGVFIFADVPAKENGYDAVMEFSSSEAFKKSLDACGLGLERMEGYKVKKLKLVFGQTE